MQPRQADAALNGLRLVVARPAPQAEGLRALLTSAGADVMVFPGMTIEPCPLSAATLACLADLEHTDWAVFVSANAVEHGLRVIAEQGGWPAGLRAAAVGGATAHALEQAGLAPVLRPLAREDSEGLLANPAWGSLDGARVTIFRGIGGREVLADGLRRAGAEVCHAEVYRRTLPVADPAPLRAALAARSIAVIVAMSGETIRNLFELCGPASRADLCATAWLVPHPRVAAAAHALGIRRVLESVGSSDQALMTTLSDFLSGPDA
ncbi:MAG: uroporphyrinogen-III synthase [Pseudomonadota bacterium]|nr:uroporphyrinogen-III synthase [Pseudomonadota bacterium]